MAGIPGPRRNVRNGFLHVCRDGPLWRARDRDGPGGHRATVPCQSGTDHRPGHDRRATRPPAIHPCPAQRHRPRRRSLATARRIGQGRGRVVGDSRSDERRPRAIDVTVGPWDVRLDLHHHRRARGLQGWGHHPGHPPRYAVAAPRSSRRSRSQRRRGRQDVDRR